MSVIEEVKQRLDIVDVVSERVPLTKAGRSLRALCPFHSEKTPSFHVFPERQTWRCFGACATGGDVFSFVMKADSVDFGEALRLLAQRAGVALDTERGRAEDEKRSRLLAANAAAAEHYHQLLLRHADATAAREYCQRRGLDLEALTRFQLGYGRDEWHDLRDHLVDRGYTEAELAEAGLLARREDGGAYDLFRGRLMFPIWDARGRVVGFGARTLGDAAPKYINSPQSAIFDKSGLLYGLDKARDALRQTGRAVIVEGYTDVIAAHQAGFTNVVASMGTSLTEKQVASLNNLVQDICLALDADAAGQQASRRGLRLTAEAVEQDPALPLESKANRDLSKSGRWLEVAYRSVPQATIRAVVLPSGRDPDEVIRGDPQFWERLVTEAPPLVDYLVETTLAATDLSDPKAKVAAAEDLLGLMQQFHDPIEQAHYLQKLAQRLGVREKELQAALSSRSPRPRSRTSARRATSEKPAPRTQAAEERLEQNCLSLLLYYSQEGSAPRIALRSEHFGYAENRAVFLAWQETPQVEALRDRLPENLRPHLEHLLATPPPPASLDVQRLALDQAQSRLEERRLKAIKREQELALAAATEDPLDAEQLAQQEQRILEPTQGLKHIFRARAQNNR